jgi:integrase
MGRVFKPFWTKKGDPKRHYTKSYYAEYTDAAGRQRRAKGFADRGATLQLLARLEREAAMVRAGLLPPGAADLARPLAALFAEYAGLLEARQLAARHVRNVRAWVPAVLAACKWHRVADVDADRLVGWAGAKRAGGCSPATVNGHLSAVKAFVRWACGKAGVAYPLGGVRRLNEAVDRRRSRRIPTPDELARLIAAAPANRRRRGVAVGGADRAMLYRVAAGTGLRASELASLTPDSFDLSAPAVTVAAADSKGRREEVVPLPAALAAALRPWLAGKPPGVRVWPGDWAKVRRQVGWLAWDVRRAGVAEFDDRGDRLTFHAFRAYYITHLIRAGADVKQVQTLARHRNVATTLDHYARVDPAALKGLADRLPDPDRLRGTCAGLPPIAADCRRKRGRTATAAAFRRSAGT